MQASDLFPESEYLRSEDIEKAGGELELTIASVYRKEFTENNEKKVKGQLSFKDSNKKLTLNSTNTKALIAMYGGDNIDKEWVDKPVTLYVDYHVEFQGKETKGIRIRLIDEKMDIIQTYWTRAKELGYSRAEGQKILADNNMNFEVALTVLEQ